jgi:Fe-S oxidoreductase
MRDEFLDLLPERRAEAEALAARAWLVEEYLVRPGVDNESRIIRVTNKLQDFLSQKSSKLSLHGHCYQKAQPPAADGYPVGQQATAEILRVVGYEVDIIPSGCCGMAGAFGYEAEHYELSMQVGELALFPAVREAMRSGNEVSAVGTSCRSQIMDGTGAAARHPLVLAVRRLGSIM